MVKETQKQIQIQQKQNKKIFKLLFSSSLKGLDQKLVEVKKKKT